ncbi:hypothetical protein DMJ13_18290 [halophilic archaeon]|nr:hypothetical protein DMJ13_18290 [halophilic archaeon]
MSIVVTEVSLPTDAFTVGTILQDHDYRIDLTQFVPIGESCIPYFWADTEDTAGFEQTVEADDRVERLIALDSSGTRTLYKIDWDDEPDGFLTTVADHDLLIEDATGTEDRWWFRLRGPDHENLAAFQQSLLDEGISLYIHRVWNPTVSEPNQYGLTEKQRSALEVAFREGYFETPRKTSLEEIGDQLNISHQSVSQRLRTGLDNLLDTTLMNETNLEAK